MTSDERREVAERLRSVTDEELRHLFTEEILNGSFGGRCVDDEGDIDVRLILNRLADLIEPQERTCHVVNEVDMFGDRTEVHDCCGDTHIRDMFTGRTYQYCPNCGARVTGVDA